MCELALTKAQSEKRKVKSESAKRKRVLTPLVPAAFAIHREQFPMHARCSDEIASCNMHTAAEATGQAMMTAN